MVWMRTVQDETQCDERGPVPTNAAGLSFSAGDIVNLRIFVNIAVEVYGSLYHVFAIGNCPGYPTGTF
jgi:hypothetical protein